MSQTEDSPDGCPLRLLQAVPSQGRERHLGACPRGHDLLINGKNDGNLCTRCFNTENRKRRERLLKVYGHEDPSPEEEEAVRSSTRLFQAHQSTVAKRFNGMSGSALPSGEQDAAGPSSNLIASSYTNNRQTYLMDSNPEEGFEVTLNASTVPRSTTPSPDQTTLSTAMTLGQVMPDLNTTETSPVSTAQQIASFQPEHTSVQAAYDFVRNPPKRLCRQVGVVGDDWAIVKNQGSSQLVARLFSALTSPAGAAPENFTQDQAKHYDDASGRAADNISAKLQVPYLVSRAKAFCIIAVDEIIRTHEIGVPEHVFQVAKSKGGRDKPETDMSCSQRAEKVINYVARNKLIAVDLIDGKSLETLVRSPEQYLRCKLSNVCTNERKRQYLQQAPTKRKSEDQELDDPSAKKKPRRALKTSPTTVPSSRGSLDGTLRKATVQSTKAPGVYRGDDTYGIPPSMQGPWTSKSADAPRMRPISKQSAAHSSEDGVSRNMPFINSGIDDFMPSGYGSTYPTRQAQTSVVKPYFTHTDSSTIPGESADAASSGYLPFTDRSTTPFGDAQQQGQRTLNPYSSQTLDCVGNDTSDAGGTFVSSLIGGNMMADGDDTAPDLSLEDPGELNFSDWVNDD